MATKPVIVGVDGSQESLRAVQWAALEARRHGSVLRIVSAPGELSRLHAYRASPGEIAAALRGIAARSLDAAITRSEEVAPGLPIETGLLSGPSAVAVADSGAGACSPAIPRAPTWWCSAGTAIPLVPAPASARSSTPSWTTPTARSPSSRQEIEAEPKAARR